MNTKILICTMFFSLISSPVYAEEMDAASRKAMEKTLELLRDKNKRAAAVNENGVAKTADDYVGKVGNANDKDRIYELSAQIFKSQIEASGGSSEKLKELLMKDPEEVLRSFTPEQRAAIRQLASEIEGRSMAPPK